MSIALRRFCTDVRGIKTKRAAVKGYGYPLRAFSLSGFLHHIRTNQKLSRIN